MRINLAIAVAALLLPNFTSAADWTNWRGPTKTGYVAPGNYATSWTEDKGIVWKKELPGLGSSTPLVVGDQVILTLGKENKNTIVSYGLDGTEKWSTSVGTETKGKHRKASGANSSPVTDGKHLIAYFKSGELACVDLEGKVVWQKNLQDEFGKDTLWWDLGTSPILAGDLVIVACMQSEPSPSYLVAFNKATGELVWKHDRNMKAPDEANQSYTTPVLAKQGERDVIVVCGADFITGHDLKTGERLWEIGGLNPEGNGYFRSISSPVVSGDIVVCPYARGATLTAVKLNPQGPGEVVWSSKDISADVPTPASNDGKVYVLNDKGRLACIDAASGKSLWTKEFPKGREAYSASPIVVGNLVYAIREDGKVYVADIADDFKIVGESQLDGLTVATPVFVNDRIYIRTESSLYCIGNK